MMTTQDETAARIHAAMDAQRALKRALHSALTPDWVHLDLSMGQLKALMGLATDGAMSVSELADWLRASKPSASMLVDRLVQQGFAERTEDQEDRRRTLVSLTGRGSELVAHLERDGGERMEAWLSQMTGDDLDALAQGVNALAAVIRGEMNGDANTEQAPTAASARADGRGDR